MAAAVLDRELLLSRDQERTLQNGLEAVTDHLRRQEQLNMELRVKHNQLIVRIHQQQVNQVGAELLCGQEERQISGSTTVVIDPQLL